MEQAQEHQTPIQAHTIINIVGEKVALGPNRQDLVPLYQRWYNDFAVLRTLHIPRPSTLEEMQAMYEKEVAEERQRRDVTFTIYDRATLHPIGRAGLGDIDYGKSQHSSGENPIIILV